MGISVCDVVNNLLTMMLEEIPGSLIRSGPPSMWVDICSGAALEKGSQGYYMAKGDLSLPLQPATHVFVRIKKYICLNCVFVQIVKCICLI